MYDRAAFEMITEQLTSHQYAYNLIRHRSNLKKRRKCLKIEVAEGSRTHDSCTRFFEIIFKI